MIYIYFENYTFIKLSLFVSKNNIFINNYITYNMIYQCYIRYNKLMNVKFIVINSLKLQLFIPFNTMYLIPKLFNNRYIL